MSRRSIGLAFLLFCLSLTTSLTPMSAADKLPPVIAPKFGYRIERNVAIPTRDGTLLSADLVRPESNLIRSEADGKFPIVIEYIPYRKDDASRSALEGQIYLAQRGFIGVRLDVRGTGGSAGVNTDEYMLVEQTDGYDAIEWLAKQPYSNGRVGMFGTSYGGFTCLQVAMHRPPHLKAIAPMYATDDRYTDDCHYTPGGSMRMYYDVGTYGGNMVAMNAVPPLPEFCVGNWAELWQTRLEKNEPYLLKWMHNQVDGPYWRTASLRPGYDRIECPVFQIAGWRDGYVNAQLRMEENLKVPRRLLIGPWVHNRPHASVPGPRIDHHNEMARFFAHWLRDEDTGFMEEPAVTVYMQEYATPSRTLDITPGTWRSEHSFPAAQTQNLTFFLQEGGGLSTKLAEKPAREFDEYDYQPGVGTKNIFWSAGGMAYYLPEDQRADEAYALTYTTEPFDKPVHVLGWPLVTVHAKSSAKVLTFVAKLADVAPDGHSALIVDGSLNGTRRKSLTDPEPLAPGAVYELQIPMVPAGWVLAPGHRLRLAISSSDFPNLWPTPERARVQLYRGGKYASNITLPVIPAPALPAPKFLPPSSMTSPVKGYGEPPTQQVLYDQITGTVSILNHRKGRTVLEDNLGVFFSESEFRCTASTLNPAQSSIVGTHTYAVEREDGKYVIVGESSIRATATTFHIVINLTITRNGQPFFQKQWTADEPRQLN